MQGMTGSSTGIRYLWMNTLIVVQKPWDRMAFGRMPRVKAREWPNFLQSWAVPLLELSNVEIALAIQYDSRPLRRERPDCTKRVFLCGRCEDLSRYEDRVKAGQSWCLVAIAGKVTRGGVLSIVWFLKRKPSLVGMVTLLSSKEIPSLVQAANSEHLFPEATATKKMVLRKRSSKEAEFFRNLGVWRVSKAWLRCQLGIFFCIGGERWNCALASSEKSLSGKFMLKASLKEWRESVCSLKLFWAKVSYHLWGTLGTPKHESFCIVLK